MELRSILCATLVQTMSEIMVCRYMLSVTSRVRLAPITNLLPFSIHKTFEGIINSEVAEQASHALLSRIEPISILLCEWCASESALLAYCALLSAARSGRVEESIAVESILLAVAKFADNRLVAQGATALAMNLSDNGVKELISQLPDNPTASLLREEIAWRIEC